MSSNSFRLFEAANSEWQSLTYTEFIIALQTIQGDFETCLVELRPPDDAENQIAALFVRGEIINLYRLWPQVKRLESNDLIASLPPELNKIELRSLSLTPNTIRLVKILIEQPLSQTSIIVNQRDLARITIQAGQNPEPLLLHLTWLDSQGLVLLPGQGESACQALVIGPGQVLQNSTNLNILYEREMKNCHVRLYHSQENTPAWQEYFIHDVFHKLASAMLARLENQGGSAARNEAVRLFNFNTTANGWNISINGKTINDQAVFSSPQEAGIVYKRLLSLLSQQSETLFGNDRPQIWARETLAGMPISYRTVYNQLWPSASGTF